MVLQTVLCASLPLNSHVEILIPNVIMLGRWGLREVVRSEGGALINGIRTLEKRPRRALLSLPLHGNIARSSHL